jgi:hypothetical protein
MEVTVTQLRTLLVLAALMSLPVLFAACKKTPTDSGGDDTDMSTGDTDTDGA